MSIGRIKALVLLLGAALVTPAAAQFSVLDTAQDNSAAAQVGGPVAPPPPCGTQPITIARMSWPSAELLAEIHARVLQRAFGCEVRVIPGDLAATGSSMSITGQPAVAPELWVTRIAEVWNAGVEAQKLRAAAPTFADNQLEAWFIPDYLAAAQPQLKSAAALAPLMSQLNGGARLRFISCPIDWACAVINRNLVAAYGLGDAVE
ncbi:MAG TPA: glycine betaine ABC transporter substrate-binding protein, partial [Devosia sp.]|nr:glycine betaine ABC transporter substrate-binding protein [Devosia sp.]